MLKLERPANKVERSEQPKLGSDLSDAPSRALPVETEFQPTAPVRVQLSRVKGWRMPPNTLKVDRSTRWGNPWPIGEWGPGDRIAPDAEGATGLFRQMLRDPQMRGWAAYPADLAPLRGKNLACWCKAGEPCHADALLEAANPALRPPVERGAQSLASLIARVEAATEPELELDAAICVALSYAGINSEGATNVRIDPDWAGDLIFEVGADDCCSPVPDVTASLDAALALVAKVLPGWPWGITTEPETGHTESWASASVIDMSWPAKRHYEAEAYTPALALILALLRALQAQPIRHDARDGASPQNNGASQ